MESKQLQGPAEQLAPNSEPVDEFEDSTEFCRVGGSEEKKDRRGQMLLRKVKSLDAVPPSEEGPGLWASIAALLGKLESPVSGELGSEEEEPSSALLDGWNTRR